MNAVPSIQNKKFHVRGYVFRPMVASRLTKSLKFDTVVEAIDKANAYDVFRAIQPSERYRVQRITRAK